MSFFEKRGSFSKTEIDKEFIPFCVSFYSMTVNILYIITVYTFFKYFLCFLFQDMISQLQKGHCFPKFTNDKQIFEDLFKLLSDYLIPKWICFLKNMYLVKC